MGLRDLLKRRKAGPPFSEGNRAELLVDGGPFFDRFIRCVQEAEHYAFIETYILASDDTGWRVAEALAERAKAGVEVALIYDAIGSIGVDVSYIEFMEEAGVKVHCFHKPSLSKRIWPWSQRNHRKILVVDGRVGIVGGMNISNDYAAPKDGGAGWRDTAIMVEGPAIAQLEAMFRRLWARAKGVATLSQVHRAAAAFDDGHRLRFMGNFPRRDRAFIREAYLRAFTHADHSIRIMNAYFIPDRVLTRALIRAAKRGVLVEVIVAGATDVHTALLATRSMYSKLLKNQINIYEWHERILHAKTAVVDGLWTTVGSSNLDYLSSFRNLEVNAGILGKRLGAQAEAQFVKDRALSKRIELADWKNRPLFQRLVEWVIGRFRKLFP